MMQAYALQTAVDRLGHEAEIINFSNVGQRRLYSVLFPPDKPKNLVKNAILLPHRGRIARNFEAYEQFIAEHFHLGGPSVSRQEGLSDMGYDVVITGSDQVWNVTIDDADDAYFLPWVEHAKKVAYAPSFGAKDPAKYADDPVRYAKYLESFDVLSVRERNGREWMRHLTGIDVPVLLDPTLLLDTADYEPLEEAVPGLPGQYLFYYSPGYAADINNLVEKVSRKYDLPVVAFNAKSFYVKGMNFSSSFALPPVENPATYLWLIKNASAVFTTSFHGTIFSTVYRKPFWTVRNGGMFGDDDRVLTLMSTLGIEDRLCPIAFDDGLDYMTLPDYDAYEAALELQRRRSISWLAEALG